MKKLRKLVLTMMVVCLFGSMAACGNRNGNEENTTENGAGSNNTTNKNDTDNKNNTNDKDNRDNTTNNGDKDVYKRQAATQPLMKSPDMTVMSMHYLLLPFLRIIAINLLDISSLMLRQALSRIY